ncbi:lactate utilization protein [Marinobacter nanhaiticus D15-8W]|uniref:Lactate utilization protein n=1 Tax=Marinobacter nanhaiticus D15-8W TaxID=626887 RepID=N6W7G8_9GAMM|nr:lactate utilization protein [Marinobacter nanhaiticus]ENO16164.1 lactate utilization protein [Marinobacter nanhaiticus D15-8W]BES72980.1 lactate utilization protein [Marinobacter nanhaiticus D15-8W]
MNSRERILARLRHGRAASPAMPYEVSVRAAEVETPVDIDTMIAALETAHAEVFRTTSAEWPDHLARLAGERGWTQWWIGQDEAGRIWQNHASRPQTTLFNNWERQKTALFDEAQAALSQARGGITETGTLVVESSPQVPRTLSLVPPVHIVVLDEATLVATLRDALAQYGPGKMPTNLIFISGPSKTADIQQTLAYGAHGPRELVVYLCKTGK